VNVLLPGSAVILVGGPLLGFLLVLLFAAAASFVIWALWIIPESAAPWMTGVALAFAAGSFVAAQLQLAQSLRRRHAALSAAARRRVLDAVHRHVDAAEYREALAALRPLQPAARSDLLIAYRFAQVLTLARQTPEARAAWRHLRAIDVHHIYRGEIEGYERLLAETEGAAAAPPAGPRAP
jgi:hypothetical protein